MKYGKSKKLVAIFTIITSIITFISLIIRFGVPMYQLYKLHTKVYNADSIGIIGSADGPTSIFVSGTSSANVIIIIFVFLSLSGIVYLIFMKGSKKS